MPTTCRPSSLGPGAELVFSGAVSFVLGGGDLGASLDATPVAPWRPRRAHDGAVLRFAGRIRGARVILAVPGGLTAPVVLGSAATDLDARLGGRLVPGQRIPVGEPSREPARRLDEARLEALLAGYAAPFILRFVPTSDPALLPDTLSRFQSQPFRVSDRSNRTGYRLSGDPLPVRADADRLSEPLAPGAIQLPPDGAPILLMADRQTTGGYPLVGHLISADQPKAAQLWPGETIRFLPVTLAQAHAAARAQETALKMV